MQTAPRLQHSVTGTIGNMRSFSTPPKSSPWTFQPPPPPSNARCQLIDGDYPLPPEAPNASHREEWLDAGHLSSWHSPMLWRSSRRLFPETAF